MIRLAQIWRYPLKSVGRERLSRAHLITGGKLPFDRHWAILHEGSLKRLDKAGEPPQWLPKVAFLRGAAAPGLQAVSGGLDNGRLVLRHPEQGDIAVDPGNTEDTDRLIGWLRPLWPDDKPVPVKLIAGQEPLTDTRKPFISINSLDSLRVLEAHAGQRLGVERWRGNLWIEGAEPFTELDWIGREISIGAIRMIVREAIGRCSATAVDVDTGQPDLDMVRTLTEAYGHSHFGVYAEVLEGGDITEMDTVIPDDQPLEGSV
ncbi:MAG: MOSC domain-containing protein [Paracoccus sp. (in: a-proteobacteria)]